MIEVTKATTVFGPPGTGKTTYLARQVVRAAEKYGPKSVLVASLTKTAATEIASRGLGIPPANVGTLHAICYRALGKPKLVVDVLNDFREKYGWDLPRTLFCDEPDDDMGERTIRPIASHEELYESMTLLRARRVPRNEWPASVVALADDWDAWKSTTGRLDFGDLIERALERFDKAPGDPKVIIYDEAQDGSALELALLKQWSSHAEYTVIAGDDDQALYTWRGASVEDFLSWSDHKIVLRESYRLPRAVWEYAEGLISRVSKRQPKEYTPTSVEGSVERSWLNLGCGRMLVDAALDALGRGSVMVLATCGYMLDDFVHSLREVGAPFHNPYRAEPAWNPLGPWLEWRPIRDALNTIFSHALDGLHEYAECPLTWHDIRLILRAFDDGHSKRGLEEIREIAQYRGSEFVKTDKPSVRPAIDMIGRDLWMAIAKRDLSQLADYAVGAHKKMRYFAKTAESLGERAAFDTNRIIVGTIHSVKGGQADTVFLFPDVSESASYSAGCLGEDERDAIVRTFYVGATRARRRLVLCQSRGQLALDL